MSDSDVQTKEEATPESRAIKTLKIEGALVISALAILLVIAHLCGDQASKISSSATLSAIDTYAFYQAKNMRQTAYKIAVEELKLQLEDERTPKPFKLEIQKKIEAFQVNVARYESDPGSGEGKAELLKKAKKMEEVRDLYSRKEPWFNFSESLIQVAIVVTSVALIVNSPILMLVSAGVGVVGVLLGVNGWFLFV